MSTNIEKAATLSPFVTLARRLYLVLAWGFLAFITIQVFLAGLGLFVSWEYWEMHRNWATYFAFVPIVMLVLAFLGKMPVSLRWISFGLYLMIVAQFLTVVFKSTLGALSSLHPVIALLLFWGSIITVSQGRHLAAAHRNEV
ncbi:MAG TPA: DUF6220 domain-containing protein [Candidatus Bathyarchaeia archaeon]|nr:DUF6220 domain-containing protein [Candidatus Bathyarchaeia archaeon]